MSFREKSDWFSFLSLCVFGYLFVHLAQDFHHRPHDYNLLFFSLLGLTIAIQVISRTALHIWQPRDAKTPVDERERLINLRAAHISYRVLLVGMFGVMGVMHLNLSLWQVAHCILFVLWLAELARYGSRVSFHRREA